MILLINFVIFKLYIIYLFFYTNFENLVIL